MTRTALSTGLAVTQWKLPNAGRIIVDEHQEQKDSLCRFCEIVSFHSKCKILGGVTEFFGKAFLCRFPPENLPRPVVYPVHSLPIQVTLGDS